MEPHTMKSFDDTSPANLSRRAWLRKTAWTAGALALGGTSLNLSGALAYAEGPLTPLRLSWKQGFFRQHGLQVELVNFSGSTDQLLEAIATGKSDAGVGMALRWIKPLEQGFDVKLTAGIQAVACVCLRRVPRESWICRDSRDVRSALATWQARPGISSRSR
jgi:NitT/TauT family transport system substrate-binding protein